MYTKCESVIYCFNFVAYSFEGRPFRTLLTTIRKHVTTLLSLLRNTTNMVLETSLLIHPFWLFPGLERNEVTCCQENVLTTKIKLFKSIWCH